MFDGPGYATLKTPPYSILVWGLTILSVLSALILFSLLFFLFMPSIIFMFVMFGGGIVNIGFLGVFLLTCIGLLVQRSQTTIVITGIHNEL